MDASPPKRQPGSEASWRSTSPRATRWIALDAMGVLFKEGDNVTQLLMPFIWELNPNAPKERIKQLYRAATLGAISTHEFWTRLSMPAESDRLFLSRFCLDPDFSSVARSLRREYELGLLTNDTVEWSTGLRLLHNLQPLFTVATVSAECQSRKPNAGIYLRFLEMSGANPQDCLFVDDLVPNLRAAAHLGFRVALFDRSGGTTAWRGCRVNSFSELADVAGLVFPGSSRAQRPRMCARVPRAISTTYGGEAPGCSEERSRKGRRG